MAIAMEVCTDVKEPDASLLANGEVIRRLLDANAALHRPTPLLVTPEEIMSTPDEDQS